MEQKPKEKEFEIKYVKSNDFKTHFANGIIGGQTINGLININFFVDTVKLPAKASRNIEGDRIGPKETLEVIPYGSNRELVAGILLDLTTAKLFETWLHERIEIQENELKKNIKELKK